MKNRRFQIALFVGLCGMVALLVSAGSERDEIIPGLRVDGNRARFVSDRMIVEVEQGSIVKVFNRLTGTDYIVPPPESVPEAVSTGLVVARPGVSQSETNTGVVGPTVTKAGTNVLVPSLVGLAKLPETELKHDVNSATWEFLSDDGKARLAIRYALEQESGDLVITQKAGSAEKGVAGVRFGLSGVVCNGDLLLPALGGIRAVSKQEQFQYEASSWQWPSGWMLPLLVFDDPNGGFWIHTKDRERRFKSVKFEKLGKAMWAIAVETENHAPFEEQDSVESVAWRLNVFSGDWKTPLGEYRQWAHATDQMPEKARYRPDWVDEIRLVIKHADYIDPGDIVRYLDVLAQHVEPSKTLLFNTEWIDGSQGAVMPYWVASERGQKFNREARKRGFRTMYFANYIGMTSNYPRFEEFKPHVVRNAYSGELEGWNLKGEWSLANEFQLYYVSPAYKPWRDAQIGQFRKLFEQNPADGLFIDQTFLMFNDRNGPLDGIDMIQGNILYHQELVEALPGVALGGESINDVTSLYQSFWEHHPVSLHIEADSAGKALGWKIEPSAFARMVPMLPFYTNPYSRPIGYLGFPEASNQFYTGWRDALKVYGGVPTITKPTLDEMENPHSEVRRAFAAALEAR